jgi:hypothetical protein
MINMADPKGEMTQSCLAMSRMVDTWKILVYIVIEIRGKDTCKSFFCRYIFLALTFSPYLFIS